MAEPETEHRQDAGIYAVQSHRGGRDKADVIALSLTAVWVVMVGGFFLATRGQSVTTEVFDPLRFVMILMALFMPVAMILVGAWAAKSIRLMREESVRLQAAIDAMRQTYIAQQRAMGATRQPEVDKKLDEIVATTKVTEERVATFASARDTGHPVRLANASADAQSAEGQAALALGTTAEDMQPPLTRSELTRAMNFPENADDIEGFAALRMALRNRQTAKLIQASQDVLTLLSEEGIYMDDLRPDTARPEIWRAFAQGERGRSIAPLGGIRDRSSLALTAARMRSDPIFRDASHHFLRQFDSQYAAFADGASDSEITEFASTRTARAFMLLGRVSGTFN
ncbi:MAG: hypothetical protein ABJO67_12500 [Pseudoruegeria sp.]